MIRGKRFTKLLIVTEDRYAGECVSDFLNSKKQSGNSGKQKAKDTAQDIHTALKKYLPVRGNFHTGPGWDKTAHRG